MKPLPLLILTAALAAAPALAQTTSADSPSTDSASGLTVTNDADFIRLANSANILEIRTSEMAQEKATSPEVKAFADQMVTDHTAAIAELASLSGTTPPDLSADLTDTLDPGHAALLEQLSKVETEGFDASYADVQRQAHEQAIALFQTYATNGQDGAVKEFAEKTLPKLQEHLDKARALIPAP